MTRVWYAEQVRLTLFTVDELHPAEPSSLWEEFSGSPPDNDEFVRGQNLRRQTGPYGDGGVLQLRLQADRIDWQLVAGQPPTDGLPNLGKYEAVVPALISRLNKWLAISPLSLLRVAFAPVLVSPVADRNEGYRELMELVPSLRLEPNGDVSDLLFQINRPTESKSVRGLKINRVMKWSVSAFRVVTLNVGVPDGSSFSTREPAYACRLELDVNNMPAPDPTKVLDSTALPAIFEEFAEIASAISLRGELA